ncbi:MAG: type I methionyl aminopeptidase [Mollicutes bacterium]|nr:type I methionyl aminopeptidase [Mollicutes bacterium]
MVTIKSNSEINKMKKAGYINYLTHEEIKSKLNVGMSTNELNEIADNFIRKHGAIPSSLNFQGYPKSICVSVNDEVVHGIPSDRIIKDGDVVSIDLTVRFDGYESDSARTYIVGNASKEVKDLVENTEKSLYEGLSKVRDGVRLSEIGLAIENFAHSKGLSVVRELVGHGIGKNMHEAPDVPNYYTETDVILKEGMTICVEPMLNLGTKDIYIEDDLWTIKTKDGKQSAHFEHTIVVTKNSYEILTGE